MMTVILFQTSYDKWHILLPVDFFLLQIQSYKERKSLLSELNELNEQSYMSLYKLTADDVEENIDGLTNKNTGTGEGTTILSYSV